ncbi:MAG: hypothetical protein WD208_13595 [Dehalococcoidia bacterium]
MPDTHVAEDRFEQYFAEKLWEWVPSTYRLEDGRIGLEFSSQYTFSQAGAVTANSALTELDDSVRNFFTGPGSVAAMMLEVTVTDHVGNTARAFTGTRDLDGDGTRIEIFRDELRKVPGASADAGFSHLNTPLTYVAQPSTAGPLRQVIEVMAQQAAVLRRSHDRLWNDQFIELADDWAVPYIADLVGTRLVSALNNAGRRADVANTIYYRRRKGTLAVLEQLIADIARWDGKVIEYFRRMGRAHHGLDPQPVPGRLTGTMPGGIADLRHAGAANASHGPFDEYHHTPDLRRQNGMDGRYGIHKLGYHLYRLHSYPLSTVMPRLISGTTGFTFDPSGRDVRLFSAGDRITDWDQWRTADEWELPAPISLGLLNDAQFVITERAVRDLEASPGLSPTQADDLRRIRRITFKSEQRLLETVMALPSTPGPGAPPYFERLLALAITPDCARSALLPFGPGSAGRNSIAVHEANRDVAPRHLVAADRLSPWTAAAPGKRIAVDPDRGRLLFLDGPDGDVSVSYHYGFPGEVGAGGYDRQHCLVPEELVDTHVTGGGTGLAFDDIHNEGVTQVDDSATYEPVSDKLAVRNLTVQAANGQRPYLLPGVNWVLNAAEFVDSLVTLDGLWIGGEGGEVILRAARMVDDELQNGSYKTVTIRHCTLDPGGEAADCSTIEPVPLVIDCLVDELIIQSSILGPIVTTEQGHVEKLVICDSVVQSLDPAVPAIAMRSGNLRLRQSTVFGNVNAHRLWASEALIEGTVRVADVQDGCFRFSAANAGSILPSPYRNVPLAGARHFFVSRRFGDAGYAQLSESAPVEISRGAENGSEMGAFSGLINPIKLDGLTAKTREFMPFGLVPMMINET